VELWGRQGGIAGVSWAEVPTAEEVQFAAPCLRSLHAPRILIITSACHTRRMLTTFRRRWRQ